MTPKLWLLSVLTLVFATGSFAAIRDCANPTDVAIGLQVKMRFCDVPLGRANIGSETGEADERPVLSRSFRAFQIGQFTVTKLQYRTVMGEEPWRKSRLVQGLVPDSDDRPAVFVSYVDAKHFARMLGFFDPTATYRLPTEAEFEYAARAGTTTKYYWGDDVGRDYAYFSGNSSALSAYSVKTCPSPILDAKDPGYCANGFGLMHMSGNVWQWTADAYTPDYVGAPINGNEFVPGNRDSNRVFRGGSFSVDEYYMRSANRSPGEPNGHYDTVGFRVVRIPK